MVNFFFHAGNWKSQYFLVSKSSRTREFKNCEKVRASHDEDLITFTFNVTEHVLSKRDLLCFKVKADTSEEVFGSFVFVMVF